jgi:hypothetical protein
MVIPPLRHIAARRLFHAATDARVYPNLLRDRELSRVDEVWSSDITYVPMRHGFMPAAPPPSE